jgi:hypothetical protein
MELDSQRSEITTGNRQDDGRLRTDVQAVGHLVANTSRMPGAEIQLQLGARELQWAGLRSASTPKYIDL